MPEHAHQWARPYEFEHSTYRECADRDCRAHQEWICAIDRWSDTFKGPSPRERARRDEAAREASASR